MSSCGGRSRDSTDNRLKFVKRPDEITDFRCRSKLKVYTRFYVGRIRTETPARRPLNVHWSLAVGGPRVEKDLRLRPDPVRSAWIGHFKFHCPAVIDDTNEGCGKEWSYVEVCRHALLSVEERQDFEEKLATLAASSYCEYKQCPKCGSNVERKDEMNVSVICSVCTAKDGTPFEFCWQCMKKWKGPAPRSDKCDNEGCINIQLETLKNCDTKTLPYSNIQDCPKIRACPTCGLLIEHQDMCKYVVCVRCHVEFCFACLNTMAICSESSEYSLHCAIPVAPRQTSIPARPTCRCLAEVLPLGLPRGPRCAQAAGVSAWEATLPETYVAHPGRAIRQPI
ncbi:uncharacterized protein LOC132403614 [Hypanus sabinus]|uniref:uncharacterized protein LOC132403614 n=1 Tax=Hypanus sabinus TaxID=79690 RepID=UPI0028C4941F|nr:uncharacterized protein LOC132403614 [Hypanus sabinus]